MSCQYLFSFSILLAISVILKIGRIAIINIDISIYARNGSIKVSSLEESIPVRVVHNYRGIIPSLRQLSIPSYYMAAA